MQNEPPPDRRRPSRRSARPAAAGPARRSICRRCPAGARAPNPAHRPSQGRCRRRRRAISAPPARWPRSRRRANSPKDTYDLGYGYVLRKDYALAEDTFQAFLKKYPTDRRAADAQFWLGESLFQRQRYDAAAQAFLDLSTKHASHAKAPEALLRLGAVARGDEAEGNVLRHARRGGPQISESARDREARRRARAEACPLLTAQPRSRPPKSDRCSPISPIIRFSFSPSPAVLTRPRCSCSPRAGARR